MVELGSKSPFGQSYDNSVFIIPAIVLVAVLGFVGLKLYKHIQEKEDREKQRAQKREAKKKSK